MKNIHIGPIEIGEHCPLAFIAGPCVIESEEMAMETAWTLKEISEELNCPIIYKSSYDKANRTSLSSYRGLAAEKSGDLDKVTDFGDRPCLIGGMDIGVDQ